MKGKSVISKITLFQNSLKQSLFILRCLQPVLVHIHLLWELILLNEKQQILFFASNNIYQEKKMEAAMKHSIFKKLFYLD